MRVSFQNIGIGIFYLLKASTFFKELVLIQFYLNLSFKTSTNLQMTLNF